MTQILQSTLASLTVLPPNPGDQRIFRKEKSLQVLAKPPRIYVKKAAFCDRKGKMGFPESLGVPAGLLRNKLVPTRQSKGELIERGLKFQSLMLLTGQSIRFI